MKKFKYRLEPLLKMKEQVERDRQKDHAKALSRVRDQEQANDETASKRKATLQHHRSRLQGQLIPAQLLLYSRFHQKLKRDTLTGLEILKALRKEENRRRAHLMEAARERKKYEKLKERLGAKHTREGEEAEKKEADEIALNTFRLKH